MSGLIYLQPRDNPEYYFRQLIHDINTNFSANTSGGVSPIQNGLNTYTGGTTNVQTINVSALTIDNIYVSGNSTFDSITANTYYNLPIDVYVTGGTYSAGTAVFSNSTGGTFNVTGFSNSINFTGTTNYYSKFNSGGTIQNGILYDNGAAGVFIAPPGDNASLSIVSPAGFYYPALGFFNNGGVSLGGISAYANSLYISGAGALITPIIVSSVVQLPYLTGNSLTYLDSNNVIRNVGIGTGLELTTGGTLFVSGSTPGGDVSVTGFTYNNSNKFTINDSTGGTFSATFNIITGLTVNGLISATTILTTTISGGTILSGSTNLYSIFAPLNSSPYRTFILTAGTVFSFTGSLNSVSINKQIGSSTQINLPLNPAINDFFVVKDKRGDSKNYPIIVSGGTKTIDGQSSYQIKSNNKVSLTFLFDGDEYIVI